MLSDEEKEAIDNMKSLLLYSKEHEYFSPFQEQEIDDMNIVLNIVEKQSKEIEELNKSDASKEQSSMKYYNLYKELVDKIKAKIEWLDKEGYFEFLSNRDILKCHNILASLLEKE